MLSTLLRMCLAPLQLEGTWPRMEALRRRPFRRKVEIDFSVRDFNVRTVRDEADLNKVLGLRRNVFYREFARRRLVLTTDRSLFDEVADHLAVFDKQGNALGTYRLISSQEVDVNDGFYTETEFEIGRFLAAPGHKLELSRACVAKDHRGGAVMTLLWRGLAAYMDAVHADFLFGLSSIPTTDLGRLADLCKYFDAMGWIDDRYRIETTDAYRVEGIDALTASSGDDKRGATLVPTLFRTYLKAGAKICSRPAIDRRFQCTDWLTVLDRRALAPRFERKFASN